MVEHGTAVRAYVVGGLSMLVRLRGLDGGRGVVEVPGVDDGELAHHPVVLVGEDVTVVHVRRGRVGVVGEAQGQPRGGTWRHVDGVLGPA